MLGKNTNIKRGQAKTLLIILGVIIALIMTMNSPIFTADNINMPAHEHQEQVAEMDANEAESQPTSGSSSGAKFNSGTRLLHIFTRNLPYLNNK